jgi:hypothetical protein
MYLENFATACYLLRNLGNSSQYEEYMGYLTFEELLQNDNAEETAEAQKMYQEWVQAPPHPAVTASI